MLCDYWGFSSHRMYSQSSTGTVPLLSCAFGSLTVNLGLEDVVGFQARATDIFYLSYHFSQSRCVQM